MKERPIIFTPENAQKIHEGTKTQTRRIIRWPDWANPEECAGLLRSSPTGIAFYEDGRPRRRMSCPYGVVGDRLWVREAFTVANDGREDQNVIYRGDPMFNGMTVFDWKWTPSIHMNREYCRTVVELTEVRVERLVEISEEDAVAEGCSLVGRTVETNADLSYVDVFRSLWESINGKDSWTQNPWIWVLTFSKRVPERPTTRRCQ
jgi:hypothetical protein